MYPQLKEYITSVKQSYHTIPDERKVLLDEIAEYVRSTEQPKLNFICTHNSRRSHLGQIWAKTAATYYGVEVQTYSGGTEATAFHPNAIAALERAGFRINTPLGKNPKHVLSFSDNGPSMECFSKRYDDKPNPVSGFAAIMTCSEADVECPVVLGASKRIKLLYEDPKIADGTPQEASKYDERCKQIATEMFYVFS